MHYKRNENGNYTVIPFFTYQIGKNPKDQKHTLLARLWENRPFCTLLVGIFISTTPMEGHLAISVKITNANML